MAPVSTELCTQCHTSFPDLTQPRVRADDFSEYLPLSLSDLDENLARNYHDILRYDAEITRLQDVTQNLIMQRATLQRRRLEFAALACPVRRLPTETISEILRHHADGLGPISLTKPRKLQIFWLGTICSRWRSIALADRYLWSNISLDFESIDHSVLNVLKVLLTRSNGGPLKISALGFESLESLSTASDHPAALAVLDILAQHASQWEEMHISIPEDIVNIIHAHNPDFAQLRTLKLSGSTEAAELGNRVLDTNGLFASAANLYQISLRYHVPLGLGIPFAQLKNVALRGQTEDEAIAIIQHCTGLDRLKVHFVAWHPVATDVPEIMNPATVLVVSGGAGTCGHVGCFLDALTMPQLKTLDISLPHLSGSPDLSYSCKNLLLRSSCQLKTLKLSHVCMDEKTFVGILRLVPFLSTLSINSLRSSESIMSRDVLKLLVRKAPNSTSSNEENRPSSELLLPHLNEFSISNGAHQDLEMLVRMLKSRWAPPRHRPPHSHIAYLESVSVSCDSAFTTSVENQLRQLKRSGMQLSVRVDGANILKEPFQFGKNDLRFQSQYQGLLESGPRSPMSVDDNDGDGQRSDLV